MSHNMHQNTCIKKKKIDVIRLEKGEIYTVEDALASKLPIFVFWHNNNTLLLALWANFTVGLDLASVTMTLPPSWESLIPEKMS